MSDAMIMKGETCKLGQVETISQELEEVKDELYKTKEEHTHIELVGDIGVELVECIGTQCEGQINLPQEQGETICSLEVDRGEVSLVRPYEVEPLHDVKRYMPSLEGIETPGSFGLTRGPDVNVPEYVSKCE